MLTLFAYNNPIDYSVIFYIVICEYYDTNENCEYTVCCKWLPNMNDLSIIRLDQECIDASIDIGQVSRSRSHFEMLLNSTIRKKELWETDEVTKLINEYISI